MLMTTTVIHIAVSYFNGTSHAIVQKVLRMIPCYPLPLCRILIISVSLCLCVDHITIFCRSGLGEDHDLLGQGTGYNIDIQNPRWPPAIDGCLAHCVQSAKCTGITYAHTWSNPFHRCHFKDVSRWEAQNFNPDSCCDHYDLIRGPGGEKNGIML